MPQYIENPTKNEGLKPTSGQRAISKGVLMNECGLFTTEVNRKKGRNIFCSCPIEISVLQITWPAQINVWGD